MPAAKVPKPKMGRPRIVIDWVKVDYACAFQATLAEIAAHLECSEDTLERACKREKGKTFAEYFEEKRQAGFAALRQRQFQVALGSKEEPPNPTMLIWLGKNWLKQRDRQIHEVTGKDDAPIEATTRVVVYMPDNGRGDVKHDGK